MLDCKLSVELFGGLKGRTVCAMLPLEGRILARRWGDVPVAEAIRLEEERQRRDVFKILGKKKRA